MTFFRSEIGFGFREPGDYPASRGYIFAVWDGERKVASADNRSIFYRACAKFVTRFASNWFVKSAWVSRESKLRKLLANNSPRAFVLFFCFARLVLSILVAKFPRIVFWESIMLPTVASPVWFEGSTFNSRRQFLFRLIGKGNTLMLKKFLSQSKRSYYDLLARVKPSQRLCKNCYRRIDTIYKKLGKCSETFMERWFNP